MGVVILLINKKVAIQVAKTLIDMLMQETTIGGSLAIPVQELLKNIISQIRNALAASVVGMEWILELRGHSLLGWTKDMEMK